MEPHVLLCTRDPSVVEAVEVSAATQQIELRVVADAAELRAAWPAAVVRLLGVDAASRWGAVGPGEAYVVGGPAAELTRCSAELSLPVLPLPDESGRLAAVLAGSARGPTRGGRVLALVGASGGLGVSTLAASLALLAARSGTSAGVVDLAPASGGLDLLLGAETVEGVRWPDLALARGELGDLRPLLPQVADVALLAQARGVGPPPSGDAVDAVVSALAASTDLTVLDSGRSGAPRGVDQTLLVVGADVRSVAAAQMLDPELRPSAFVARSGPGRRVPAAVMSRTLGLECAGEIGHDKALPRLAEMGLPPLPGPARRFRRDVAALLRWLLDA
ncbi:septum site-determining protein Ssd [Tessaracoccus aquimaris]|uniref:septum site-determining protein Ssd n=1 Tax=Tessaracoccus aquimaris TaxID=1332264 RepID=UPI000988F75F|nr:septum site-determining protein Ssd [Tessaracoccus aquimaris]